MLSESGINNWIFLERFREKCYENYHATNMGDWDGIQHVRLTIIVDQQFKIVIYVYCKIFC